MLRQTSNNKPAHDKTHTKLALNRFSCFTIQIYLLKCNDYQHLDI